MPGNRILLDNNVPRHLIPLLRPREATHAAAIGWATLGNGELVRAAHADGFAANDQAVYASLYALLIVSEAAR